MSLPSTNLTSKYPNGVKRADILIISQYNSSTNLHKYIECFTIVFNDILQACIEVATQRYLGIASNALARMNLAVADSSWKRVARHALAKPGLACEGRAWH